MTDDVVAGAPIELDGVRFSYDGGATWVLDGVDLRVGPVSASRSWAPTARANPRSRA